MKSPAIPLNSSATLTGAEDENITTELLETATRQAIEESDGPKIRNCLFSTHEWDVREFLRDGASEDEIANVVRAAVHAKKAGHGIDSDQFVKPERAMYQIGG